MAERRVGGFTTVANELTAIKGKTVTRQGVYMWWRRRDRNQFPERHPIPSLSSDRVRMLFDIDEVTEWYQWYMGQSWHGRKDLYPRQVCQPPVF